MVADGSFLPANVSVKSSVEVIETVVSFHVECKVGQPRPLIDP